MNFQIRLYPSNHTVDVPDIKRLNPSGSYCGSVGDCSKIRSSFLAGRDGGRNMKKVALSEMKDDLSRFLRLAEKEEIVIKEG
jgi:hypothetical protein